MKVKEFLDYLNKHPEHELMIVEEAAFNDNHAGKHLKKVQALFYMRMRG